MRVLRFIWSGVLAFDRIGKRIPQLVQIWLGELFFVVPLMFFIAKIIDIRGGFGVPGTGERLPGVFWGALAVSLVAGFFFVRGLVRPQVRDGSWTPVSTADIGDFTVGVGVKSWTVEYKYLTSHPSYALLLLLTAPIPAVLVLSTIDHGGSTFYYRVAGVVGLCLLAAMALARILAWYVFRFGRSQLEKQGFRAAWEIAWKPVLMLMVMIYAIIGIPLGWMWFQEQRTIAALPVVSVQDGVDHVGQYRRVDGEVVSEPVYWAPRGTGRGGDNYAGSGVLVKLPSGGDVLLLAESMSVPDFIGVMRHVKDGKLKAQGKVIDTITDSQSEYYGFQVDAFPEPSPDGRVMVLLSYP